MNFQEIRKKSWAGGLVKSWSGSALRAVKVFYFSLKSNMQPSLHFYSHGNIAIISITSNGESGKLIFAFIFEQATFCGSSLGKRAGNHFNTADFESMGYHLCDTLLDYCDPDNLKV